MIKHVVFFRLKESDIPGLKEKQLEELKYYIENLGKTIEVITAIEAGINISDRDAAYDLALISDFKSEEDLRKYNAHPEHQKVVSFLEEIKKEIAVVDYIY